MDDRRHNMDCSINFGGVVVAEILNITGDGVSLILRGMIHLPVDITAFYTL